MFIKLTIFKLNVFWRMTPCILVKCIDVSEDPVASNEIHLFALKMEATRSLAPPVHSYYTTKRHILSRSSTLQAQISLNTLSFV